MANTEPKTSSTRSATTDPPDNDYPKTGHDAQGRGVLFQTRMVDPWGGSLKITLSVDPSPSALDQALEEDHDVQESPPAAKPVAAQAAA